MSAGLRRAALAVLRRAALVVLLLLGAGCGPEVTHATPHGLEIETLEAAPVGEALEIPTDPQEGAWEGTIRKQWVEVRDGGVPRTGRAELGIALTRRLDGDHLVSALTISVLSAEGTGETYLRAFDHLEVEITHDASGRLDPRTLRFGGRAASQARTFLSGYWIAGLSGLARWRPDRPLRAGAVFSRKDLGLEAALQTLTGLHGSAPRLLGGGRVESIQTDAEGTRVEIRLETLVDAEQAGSTAAMTLGIRERGHATFDARSGLPLQWSLEECTRLKRLRREEETTLDLTLRVDGELAPVAR